MPKVEVPTPPLPPPPAGIVKVQVEPVQFTFTLFPFVVVANVNAFPVAVPPAMMVVVAGMESGSPSDEVAAPVKVQVLPVQLSVK